MVFASFNISFTFFYYTLLEGQWTATQIMGFELKADVLNTFDKS